MYVLSSKIEIGDRIKLDFVTQVEINSSWQTFTDTAEITIPRKIRLVENEKNIQKNIREYVKQGDRVVIQLGYDGKLNKEFEGFVTRIKPDAPLVISCEDYMYHLKRVTIKKSWKTVKLYDLISYLIDEYDKERNKETDLQKRRPEITFEASRLTDVGGFIADNITISKVLEHLKEFGLSSFFRGNKLHVGFQSEFMEGFTSYDFGFQENIISNELEYRLTEDVKVKIEAVSNMPNGQKITATAGDPEGETQSLNFYNISKANLQKNADETAKKLKRDGYKGSFTTFGMPWVKHGDSVKITNNEYSDRGPQVYEVDTVKITFGTGGYRRVITPGYRTKT